MLDYNTKEVEIEYSFSTISEDRTDTKEVRINGRNYIKFGENQAVTLVGILYNVYDPSINRYKKVLHVGVSKQNPRDLQVSKQIAYETAHVNALMNPQCVMEVGDNWRKYNFTEFARNYVNAMKLQFVKTTQELERENHEAIQGIEQ